MRALLVVNPAATTTSARTRRVLLRALASELDLEVSETEYPGHAGDLARDAAAAGLDVVVAFGGDGTINEVVNGLITGAEGAATAQPDLAVVPGGSANVFPRALGLPREAVEATGAVIDALRGGSRRLIGLGRAAERYFTVSAGLGIDAEVVRGVERLRDSGVRASPALYVWEALRQFFVVTDRREPQLTLDAGPSAEQVFLAIVSNASPWTYLGPRAVTPSPRASFDAGLDLYALRRLGTLGTLRQIRQMLTAGACIPTGRQVHTRHDVAELTITARRPAAFQVDGEYLDERDHVVFRSARDALRVVV